MVGGVLCAMLLGSLDSDRTPLVRAALFGPVPADAFGELQDEFTDDMSIWAYVRSDIAGGSICVARDGIGECATGENFVVGIGTIHTLVSPPIAPGDYQLLVKNSIGQTTEVSDTFNVFPCGECPATFEDELVAAFKASAAENAERFDHTCLMSAVLEQVAGKSMVARGVTVSPELRVRRSYGNQTSTFAAAADFTGSLPAVTIPNPATANINKGLDILQDLSCGVGKMYADIAADPPDPNFDEVFVPATYTIDPLAPPELDTAARSTDGQWAQAEGTLRGFEKYQGALAASNLDKQELQAQAAGNYALALAALQRTAAADLRTWATAADSDPELANPLDPDTLDDLLALRQRVANDGFLQGEIDQFHGFGYTDDDIAAIRAHFVLDLGTLPSGATYGDLLRTAATAIEDGSAATEAFGWNALRVAGRLAVQNAETPTPTATATPSETATPTLAPDTTTPTPTHTSTSSPTTTPTRDPALNNPPSVLGTSRFMNEDGPALGMGVAAADPDGDPLTLRIVDPPSHGKARAAEPGAATLYYVPDEHYFGTDTFTFVANDGLADSNVGTVTIDIAAVNDAPIAFGAAFNTLPDASLTIPLDASDVDDTLLTFATLDAPGHGTLSAYGANSVVYTPNAGYVGPDSFTYRAFDDDGAGSNVVPVAVHVGAIPPPPSSDFDRSGREFWLMFNDLVTIPSDRLLLFITSEIATSGIVEASWAEFATTFSVEAGTVTTVELPVDNQVPGLEGLRQFGVHVKAAADVTVYGLNDVIYASDAFGVLPVDALGTEHLALTYETAFNGGQIGIVAAHDNTRLTIIPSHDLNLLQPDEFGGFTLGRAGVPMVVELDRRQTYNLRAAFGANLDGTHITSDKPVSVFGGAPCAFVPAHVQACNHLVEQMPPVSAWGSEYFTMPLASRFKGDTFVFLSNQDGTNVSINGVAVGVLDRGERMERILQGPSHIKATGPLLVAQFSNGVMFDLDERSGSPNADPFMMLIPPAEQFDDSYVITTPPDGFVAHWVNVVAPAVAINGISLDGTAIDAGLFTPIGSSGFAGAQVPIQVGEHQLSASVPFGVAVYGYEEYDGYGYIGGGGVGPVALADSITLEPPTTLASIGNEVCLTATVRGGSSPLAGIRVDFTTSGQHALGGHEHTAEDGTATFCYRGNGPGSDTIEARAGSQTAVASVEWASGEFSTSTPSPTATSTATATVTPTSTPTPLPTGTATPTESPVPTATDTPAASSTETPAPTASSTSTPTPSPTPSNTSTPTATATVEPSPTATATNTAAPTNTAVPTYTSTPVATATPTRVVEATRTVVSTRTVVATSTTRPGTATVVATTTAHAASPTVRATKTAPPTRTPRVEPTRHPKRCPDVDGNGKVNVRDLLLVLKHRGKRYQAVYDVNADRRVNLQDVAIVFSHLGKRCR